MHRLEKVPNFWKAEGVFLEGAGPEPAGWTAQTPLTSRRISDEASVRARVERTVRVREVKCMIAVWIRIEAAVVDGCWKVEKRVYVVVRSVMLCERGVPLAKCVEKKTDAEVS